MSGLQYADAEWHRSAQNAAMAAVAVGALALGTAAVYNSYDHHHHGYYGGHYGYHHCD